MRDPNPFEISIRRARLEDIPALCALLNALFSIEADFTPNAATQRRGLELLLASDDEACVLVAQHRDRVVGMCSAQIVISTAEGGQAAWVEDVVVEADMRGRGLGARLLGALEEWARRRGLKRLQLLADRNNDGALEFYARQGWRPTQLSAWRKAM